MRIIVILACSHLSHPYLPARNPGSIILFSVAVAVFGFALATHRQYGIEAITERIKKHIPSDAKLQKRSVTGEKWSLRFAMLFFIVQDIAGVIYSFFGHGATPTFPIIAATISMSGFTIVPFFIGHMTLALAEAIPAEKREQFYSNLYELWQDALITAAGKWAKKARSADPAEILAPVIKSLMDASPDGMHSDAIKGLFRMDGDDKLVPFRPQTAVSSTNGAGEEDDDDEE